MERVRRIFPFQQIQPLARAVDPKLADQALAAQYALWAKRWEERAAAFLHRRALEECRLAALEFRRRGLRPPVDAQAPEGQDGATSAQLRTILEWEKNQRMDGLEKRIRIAKARLTQWSEMAQVCLERAREIEVMRKSVLERP